jgi:hypothetical protein
MTDPEIDIQVVIGSLTTKIAQMMAEMAVKDALIEALRAINTIDSDVPTEE